MNNIESKIIEFLKETHIKFPSMKFKLGYSGIDKVYIVEVKPLADFKHNESYGRDEIKFTDEFEAQNEGYELVFVSDDSVSKIVGKPIFEIDAEHIASAKRKKLKRNIAVL